MKLLEMVKDVKISIVSPPLKSMGVGDGGGGCSAWDLISDYARREEKFHKCIF